MTLTLHIPSMYLENVGDFAIAEVVFVENVGSVCLPPLNPSPFPFLDCLLVRCW